MIGAPITEVITETAAPRPMRMPLPGCGGSASPVGGCSTGLGNCMRPSSGRPPGAGSSCVRTESGHTANPLTVWNRTPARGAALAAEGAKVADSTAEAVAANTLIVTCLLDDTSVDEVLTGIDLADRDLVNLTTSTPAQARTRAQWARERGAATWTAGSRRSPPDDRRPGSRRLRLLQRLAGPVRAAPGTTEQQGVSPELLSPYFELMRRRLAEGSGEEGLTGVIDLLVR